MEFVYGATWDPGDGVVAVDADLPATVQICHDRGHSTPDRLRADLAVEMAFKLVDDDLYDDLTVAATEGYGSDRLLATWVLRDPETARRHRDLLVDAAASGDYLEYRSDAGVKLDLLVDQYRYGDESPLSFKLDDWPAPVADETVLEVLLETLPNLLDQVDDYQYVWWDAWKRVLDDDDAFQDGVFETTVGDDVALIEGPYFPGPRAATHHVDADHYLYAVDGGDGTAYRLDAAYHAWADVVDREPVPIPDVADLAAELNRGEPAKTGRWMEDGYTDRGRTELLRFAEADGSTPPSGWAPGDVHERVVEAIRVAR